MLQNILSKPTFSLRPEDVNTCKTVVVYKKTRRFSENFYKNFYIFNKYLFKYDWDCKERFSAIWTLVFQSGRPNVIQTVSRKCWAYQWLTFDLFPQPEWLN